MATYSICPWCSYALLLQVKNGKQQLYCFHCHQEIPAGIAQIRPPQDFREVNKYSNFSNSSVNFPPNHHLTKTAALATSSVGLKTERKLEPTVNQLVKQSTEDILLNYLAHFVSRGKVVISPTSGKLTYSGKVYQNIGYTSDFREFWLKLRHRSDFKQLYLEGDVYCFGQFLNDSFEMGECVRCNMQVPIPLGMHQYKGTCHLCDRCPTTSLINLLAVGTPPTNQPLLQKLFALQGFKVSFIEHPLRITGNVLSKGIELVLIYAEVSEKVGNLWLELLCHHSQLRDIPVVALSRRAGRGDHNGDNNKDNTPVVLEKYLQQSLGAESLASSLHYLAHQRHQDQSSLHWLPH